MYAALWNEQVESANTFPSLMFINKLNNIHLIDLQGHRHEYK